MAHGTRVTAARIGTQHAFELAAVQRFGHLALGGNAGRIELAGFLRGVLSLPPGQLAVLTHALDERLDERDESAQQTKIPYGWSGAVSTR